MASDDRTYFLRRAKEEEAAIRAAASPVARARHEELASSYRMRFQHMEREAKGEPPPSLVLAENEPFIAAPVPVPDGWGTSPMKILVR